ncbi:MAG TPA: hypothetical protein VGN12_27845 [Pirellulales bacterium]
MNIKIIFAVAFFANSIPASFIVAHDDGRGGLVERAKNATDSDKMIQFLRWVHTRSENEVREFVQANATSDDQQLRLMSALLLPTASRGELPPEFVARLLSDASPRVRRTAWFTAREDQIPPDAKAEASRSRDLYIRASIVLSCDSAEKVAQFCRDTAPFVRALAIRRLGKIASDKPVDSSIVEDALRICCVDSDQLVRSNAIIAARGLLMLPKEVAPGMVLDNREFLSLGSVLVGEDEAKDDRSRYGLTEEYFPTTYLLNLRSLGRTIPERPSPMYKVLILPMSVTRCIGGEAANLWNTVDPEAARPFLRSVVASPQDPSVLQLSLSRVLGMPVDWPSQE